MANSLVEILCVESDVIHHLRVFKIIMIEIHHKYVILIASYDVKHSR